MVEQFSLNSFEGQGKKKIIAILLAFLGAIAPFGGLHKFYVGQPIWGVIYLFLGWHSPITSIACAVDAVLYIAQFSNQWGFQSNSETTTTITQINQQSLQAKNTVEIAEAIRQLENLRQQGLVSEYEFEQKRRQLLD